MDLLSSLAKLTGSPAPSSDSQDHLEAFLGSSNQARTSLIVEASGRPALRSGDWAIIPPHHGQEINKQVNIELDNAPEYQLSQLTTNHGQQHNSDTQPHDTHKQLITESNHISGKE